MRRGWYPWVSTRPTYESNCLDERTMVVHHVTRNNSVAQPEKRSNGVFDRFGIGDVDSSLFIRSRLTGEFTGKVLVKGWVVNVRKKNGIKVAM